MGKYSKEQIMKLFDITSETFDLIVGQPSKIQKYYRKASKKHHPDQITDNDPVKKQLAQENFIKLGEMKIELENGDYWCEENQANNFTFYETQNNNYYSDMTFETYNSYSKTKYNSDDTNEYKNTAPYTPKHNILWHLSYPFRVILYLLLLLLGYGIFFVISAIVFVSCIIYIICIIRLLYLLFTHNYIISEILLCILGIIIGIVLTNLHEEFSLWAEIIHDCLHDIILG